MKIIMIRTLRFANTHSRLQTGVFCGMEHYRSVLLKRNFEQSEIHGGNKAYALKSKRRATPLPGVTIRPHTGNQVLL